MKNLNQLLLNFKYKQNFNYNDFYVSKSNYYAFKLVEKWPVWEKNILNIFGEKFYRARKVDNKNFLKDVSNINPGDLIVHIEQYMPLLHYHILVA